MLEVTIISGKGGTGKTSLTAAFAKMCDDAVICDLDVDAPDLHILLHPRIGERHEFMAGNMAAIDPDRCLQCGDCLSRCRFDAITESETGYAVDETACEGCGVCAYFCPVEAVTMEPCLAGHWFRSVADGKPMIHAEMVPGAENSGLLVTRLRQEARAEAARRDSPLILADGPPGIGCPVISAVTGSDLVVLVTEPTPSGLHDLARAADVCAHFDRAMAIIVNKADLDADCAAQVDRFAADRDIPVLARIPYHRSVVDALMARRTLADIGDTPVGRAAREAWQAIRALADQRQAA